MDNKSRTMAFSFIIVLFVGVIIGSLLPELGNFATEFIEPLKKESHYFNSYFIAWGIFGILFSLHLGYRLCRK